MGTVEIDATAQRARERFDNLTATQVIERLPRLSDNGLHQVLAYEEQTRARATVLAAARKELDLRTPSNGDDPFGEPSSFGANGTSTASADETHTSSEAGPTIEHDDGAQESRETETMERTNPPNAEHGPSDLTSLPWVGVGAKSGHATAHQSSDGWELPPKAESRFDRTRHAIRSSRGRAIAVAIVLAIILLLVGIAIGKSGTVTQSKYDTLRSELTKSQADTALARQNASQAESKAQIDAQAQLSQARAQDQTQLQQQQAALSKQQADAQAAQAAAQGQAQANAAQKAALDQQQAAVDANSFSDGLYQVGRDVQPGRYHTSGAPDCYWAKLRSSNTSDIIDNNISSGPQTITIDSPYFDSENCGSWTKVS